MVAPLLATLEYGAITGFEKEEESGEAEKEERASMGFWQPVNSNPETPRRTSVFFFTIPLLFR